MKLRPVLPADQVRRGLRLAAALLAFAAPPHRHRQGR